MKDCVTKNVGFTAIKIIKFAVIGRHDSRKHRFPFTSGHYVTMGGTPVGRIQAVISEFHLRDHPFGKKE